MVKNDNEFDQWLLEENRQITHQGMLDAYIGHQVYEADITSPGPLKPSIRTPAEKIEPLLRKIGKECESTLVTFRLRWSKIPTSTLHSRVYILPPSSHLQ